MSEKIAEFKGFGIPKEAKDKLQEILETSCGKVLDTCEGVCCHTCLLDSERKELLKDYLKESEFKVGDRVECIEGWGETVKGHIYTFAGYLMGDSNYIQLEEMLKISPSSNYNTSSFKLANNQTKTIKEEESNMKTIHINEIVDAVFDQKEEMKVVQEQLGTQIEKMFEGCVDLGVIWTTENKVAVLKRANDMKTEEDEAKSCS